MDLKRIRLIGELRKILSIIGKRGNSQFSRIVIMAILIVFVELAFISVSSNTINFFLTGELPFSLGIFESFLGKNLYETISKNILITVLLVFFIFLVFKFIIVSYLYRLQYSLLYGIKTDLQIYKAERIVRQKNKKAESVAEELLISGQHLISYFLSPIVVIATELLLLLSFVALSFFKGFGDIVILSILTAPVLIMINKVILVKTERLSGIRATEENDAAKQISDAESHFLEIYANGFERPYLNNLKKKLGSLNSVYAENIFLNFLPRQVLEFVILAIIVIALYSMSTLDRTLFTEDELALVLAMGVRFIPSIGRLMGSFQNISFAKSVSDEFLSIISESDLDKKASSVEMDEPLRQTYNFATSEETGLLVIYGESGSGKSTLLTRLSTKLSSNMHPYCYVAQSPYVHAGSLYENVSSEYFNRPLLKNDLLKLNLSAVLERDTILTKDSLSGGEKVRLGLLRAVYSGKKIIIIDEPTNALDENNAKLARDMLLKLTKTCKLILVTHDEALIGMASKTVKL